MDSYIEIKLKPDAEMPLNWLLNMLYTKLHKTLCDLNSTSIGVSFPAYQQTLGDTLRLHGTQTDLDQLQTKNWIGGMSGYCQLSAIQAVPD